ncbi:MAG: sulfite exporter TauE/SafE family protein [Clostridia bacterium]|nr:sulfite exporter TauE/SafE family protein [Clostridia bacterium]
MLETVFLGAMSACSSLLQSVTGFGFAIVMMAIMPLFLSMEHALAISTILSAILNAVILLRCWRDINLKQLWLPVCFCLCGSTFGTFLMATSPSPIYKRLLGVFLIFLAIWLYFFSDRVRIKPSLTSAGIAAGASSPTCPFRAFFPNLLVYTKFFDFATVLAIIWFHFLFVSRC